MATDTKLFSTDVQESEMDLIPETQMKQFLIFESDELLFGADVEYVVEIITNHIITPLPIVPSYIRGIINLRGQIIPVLDIRLRLGKSPADDSCIIVLNMHDIYLGILVDSVAQMVSIPPENILPVPDRNGQELVSGMCTLADGKTMLVLDCDLLAEPQ